METFKDRNGIQIKVGHELDVPLDVFSNGIVILNDDKELSLELRYESKTVPLKRLDKNVFNHVEIQNERIN
jgi:hypothetical protein